MELATEMIRDARNDAEIVLAVVYRVGDSGVNPIAFNDGQAESSIQPRRDATTSEYSKCVSIDSELKVHVLFRAA